MSETYTVRVEPLDRVVECRADQAILDACLRAGVWLPHACTHGTCGTCKAIVLEGNVDHGDASPYALLDSEREEGCALICVAKARSDLVIEGEIDAEEGVEVHPVRDYTGTVELLDEVSPDVRRLFIALDRPLSFNPGQYIQLVMPDGDSRPYSVASTPATPDRIWPSGRPSRCPGRTAASRSARCGRHPCCSWAVAPAWLR